MNFIYVIHLPYWNHLIAFKKLYKNNNKNKNCKRARASRAPPFVVFVAAVVSVASVATAVCDQVVTVQHVDDIDEVHQLDPVHQVDHKDELWGDQGRTFRVFSSKSSHFVPLWARSSFLLRSRQFSAPGLAGKCQKTITEITGGPNVSFFASNFANSELSSWLVGTHPAIPAIPRIPRIRDGGRRSDPG